MNSIPKIIVITPVYNGENFIGKAIESVMSQKYSNLHLLIIDDGSTDNTPVIIEEYSKNNDRIKSIRISNSGVSKARNTAIEYIIKNEDAYNTYIAFCDADDLWAKDCLTNDFEHNLVQDVVCFQSCYMSNDSSLCSPPHSSKQIPEISEGGRKAVFRYPFHFGAFLYKASLFKDYDIRFDTSLKYNEDKVLQMQLLYLAEKIEYIPRMMYLYRKNPSSVMHKRPHGIPYYKPLINGWMNSDDNMRQYANDKRENLTAGYVLASIYVIDMAKEHYCYWGSRKEFNEFTSAHPIYEEFLKLNKLDILPKQYKEYLLLRNHPILFMLKHKFLGIPIRFLKLLYKTRFVANFFYKREFTIKNNYI